MTKPAAGVEQPPTVKELRDRIQTEIDKQLGIGTKEAAMRVKYLSEALRHLKDVKDPSKHTRLAIVPESIVALNPCEP